MVKLFPRLGSTIRQTHYHAYGRGFGSFLKSAGNAIKNSSKELVKVASSKGKEIAKSAAGHLKEAAKETINKGISHAKNLASEAAANVAAEGKRILAEHGQQLVDNLAKAESFGDIGNAVKQTAKNAAADVKDSATNIVKNSVADARAKALDLAKSGVINLANAGIKTAMDTAGITPTDDQATEDTDGSEEPNIETGEGIRSSISDLIAGNVRKRKSYKKKVGGALFLPGGGQSGNGLFVA